jgi:hypothetical protein
MDHRELIRERGGIRPLARALAHKNHTTVQGWWERRNIPPEQLPAVQAVEPIAPQAAAA